MNGKGIPKKRDKTQNIKLQRAQSTFWVQAVENHPALNAKKHALAIKSRPDTRNREKRATETPLEPEHPSTSPQSVCYPESAISEPAAVTENDGPPELTSNFGAHLSELNIVGDSEQNMEESEDTVEEVVIQNGERKEELKEEPFRAFVVMNGSTTTITSKNASNKMEKVILEAEHGGDDSKSTERKSKAIVVGQITDTLCSKPEAVSPLQSGNETELTPLVSNLINDASNICVNGIRGMNVEEMPSAQHIDAGNAGPQMLDDRIVRPEVVSSLMHKMAKGSVGLKRPPNNPVTNKFSTYFQRDDNDNVGGTLLTKEEDILDGFISLFAEPKEESVNPADSGNAEDVTMEEAVNGGIESSIRMRMRSRVRQRKEHAHFKRAKKYNTPPEELTRLQIREDIRKMRNPQMEHMAEILDLIGFSAFINHERYLPDSNLMNRPKHSVYREDDVVIDADVQFIGLDNKHKKKRKRKRKHRHRSDHDHHPKAEDMYSSNIAFSELPYARNGEPRSQNAINIDRFDDGSEPRRKRLKPDANTSEGLRCPHPGCYKVFELEVDLLIHKVNDNHAQSAL